MSKLFRNDSPGALSHSQAFELEKQRMTERAAAIWGVDAKDVNYDSKTGVMSTSVGEARSMTFKELAARQQATGGYISGHVDLGGATGAVTYGGHIVDVEVDPETGAIALQRYVVAQDAGRLINPMIAAGQLHGGVAQGVGQAMWELCTIDPDSGQPLSGSFMDYGMPHGHTLPSFKCEIVEVLSPTNPLGVKAGGEGGTTPALAVIISAVADALRDLGIHDLAMPATPYAIWQAIQNAKSKNKAA